MIVEFSKYQKPEVRYYDNGQKQHEVYYLNGKIHRENGPAYQCWYNNGQKQHEIYRLNGKFHREDGPAYQFWHENGQKESEEYYLDGIEYSRSEWLEKLKEIGSIHYKDQKILFDAEKYNL